MIKRLTLVASVIAVVAFAAPAMASANPQLTMPAGTTVPKGTLITGTSTNAVTKTSIGELKCEKVVLNGEVTENSGTSVTGVGIGEGTTTTCTDNGAKISIVDVTLSDLHSSESEKGTATFSFKGELPVVGTCTYTGTGAPFTYVTNSDIIKFTEATLTASPKACGTAHLSGEFTLETTGGGEVILD